MTLNQKTEVEQTFSNNFVIYLYQYFGKLNSVDSELLFEKVLCLFGKKAIKKRKSSCKKKKTGYLSHWKANHRFWFLVT
jgi:hypothetical protein